MYALEYSVDNCFVWRIIPNLNPRLNPKLIKKAKNVRIYRLGETPPSLS